VRACVRAGCPYAVRRRFARVSTVNAIGLSLDEQEASKDLHKLVRKYGQHERSTALIYPALSVAQL
jgi:hypothetical protein